MNQGENKYSIEPNENTLGIQEEIKDFEENGTFCRVGSEDCGFLEVDLQITKQKGVEMRNISFAIPVGVDEDNNPMKAEMFFINEKSFCKFKDFIAKLNWND